MLIFQRPHTVTVHGVILVVNQWKRLGWFFCFEIEPIDLSGTSRSCPPPVGLKGWRLEALLADSSCMSGCKNSSCCRSQQARWGLRRQWYLPPWHKRELSSTIDDVTIDLACSFLLRPVPWVLLTLKPWKLFLLSFIHAALEIRVFFSRSSYSGEGSFFNSLMPPLLWFAVWVRARTRKAAGCQMRTVIRPVSTGLWLQVQICLQGWTKLSMEKIIHAETTERREGEVGWLLLQRARARTR